MERFLTALMLLVSVLAPLKPVVSAQSEGARLHLVAITTQGISFLQSTEDGTLLPAERVLNNFAIEAYGGSAEWMIVGKESFAIAPDGRHIAFTAQRGAAGALFIYDINNDHLQQQPIDFYWLLPFLWSPDSEAVLLSPALPYGGELPKPYDYIYDIETNILTQITFTDDWKVFQWSADGDSLVYFGTCDPDPCGSSQEDLYLVNRNGGSRIRLTDFATDPNPFGYTYPCYIQWSAMDQRWYYAFAFCSPGSEPGPAYIYSTSIAGDNRLELDLETYLQSTNAIDINFWYAIIAGIHPRPEGIQISFQTSFYPDADQQELSTEIRVIRLDDQGQIQTIYQQSIYDVFEFGAFLTESVISPDGGRMIARFAGRALVIDTVNNQIIREITGSESICDVRWLDDTAVVYNVGGHNCVGAGYTTPQDAFILDITSGVVTPITGSLDGPAWVIPFP
jgi:hypothetical protein